MTRVTTWFDLRHRPTYRGCYELRRSDKTIVRARFRGRHWYDAETKERLDVSSFNAWRGRNGIQKQSVVANDTDYLHRSRSHKYVRKLFRHWVSDGDYVEAAMLHKIGILLSVKFSAAERSAFKAIDAEMKIIERNAVEDRFKRFWLGHGAS